MSCSLSVKKGRAIAYTWNVFQHAFTILILSIISDKDNFFTSQEIMSLTSHLALQYIIALSIFHLSNYFQHCFSGLPLSEAEWRWLGIPVQYKTLVALLQKLQQLSHPTNHLLCRSQNLNGPLYLQELWWHNPSMFLPLCKHKTERESNNKEAILRIRVWQYQHKYRPALAQQLTFVFGHHSCMRVQNTQLLNIIVFSDFSNPRNREAKN